MARDRTESPPPAGTSFRRPAARGRRLRPAGASVEGRIFGAAAGVGGLSAGLSVLSMGKEMFVAASFGTDDALDAFVVALLPVSFAVTVVAEAFSSALIPTYVQERERRGRAAAQRLFSEAVAVAAAWLLAVAAALALLAPHFLPLLGLGFAAGKLAQTQRLFLLLLPVVVLRGVTTIWSAALHAGERFGLAGAAPLLLPAATVGALLVWRADPAVDALVAGAVGGLALQLALLGWGLKRRGTALAPRWRGGSPALRRVIGQYLPLVAGASVMGGTALVDGAMAATLAPGSAAALHYGNKVVAAALTVGAGALGTVVLPVFSRLIGARDWGAVRRVVRTYSLLILLVTVPAALALCVLSEPLVRLIFERGEFTAADTRLVGRVQALYALQIPFYVLGILFVRLISAAAANRVLLFGSLLNLTLNVVLNYVFMRRLGVAGIALSTACVYAASCAFLVTAAFRMLPGLRGGRPRDARCG